MPGTGGGPAAAGRCGFSRGGGLDLTIAIDDFDAALREPAVIGFLQELSARLPDLQMITVGREPAPAPAENVLVPPFSYHQTDELLKLIAGAVAPATVRMLHDWTGGVPQLLRLAGAWLQTATAAEVEHGASSLAGTAEVQSFLLDQVTGFLDSQDRIILEAASVFAGRFSDDALAHVSGRTRGDVLEAGVRLVRAHVATRSREGNTSFFNQGVRDYVYARIPADRLIEFERRAGEWYRLQGEPKHARDHEKRASVLEVRA